MKKNFSDRTIIFSLFLFALILRMIGIIWGDMQRDENFWLSVRVLSGEIVPQSDAYPPFLNYLNAIAYVLMYGIGRLLGFWHLTEDFKMQWFQNPTPFYFTGRMVTASLGSLASPIAYLIAKKLNCQWIASFLVGILIAILPINVLLSHISKSDVPLGTSLFLIIFFYLRHEKVGLNSLLLGVFSATAMGFKQSSLFFITPLISILVVQIYLSGQSVIKFMAIYLVSTTVTFSIVALGIVLDLSDFIRYQHVESLLDTRVFSFYKLLINAPPVMASTQFGASLPLMVLWFFIPLIDFNKKILTLWVASTLGMGILIILSGDHLQANLFLPFSMIIVLLTSISITRFLEKKQYFKTNYILLSILIFLFILPTGNIIVQSLRTPISYEVSKIIQKIAVPNQTKILASNTGLINLTLDPKAILDDKERNRELAEKYHLTLPKLPKEKQKLLEQKVTPSYYIRRMPWASGGLEIYDESKLKTIVPYKWPIQKQEWELSYWTDRGFSIFVITDEEKYLTSGIPAYEGFHKEIKDQCKLISEIPTKRPLFFESDVKIYQCVSEKGKRLNNP